MASEAASQVTIGALRYVIAGPVTLPRKDVCLDQTHINNVLNSAIFDQTQPQVREPIVQCVQIKALPAQPGQAERYRAVFSDIANYVQTMLATRMYCLMWFS
jgi:hypothetical protein